MAKPAPKLTNKERDSRLAVHDEMLAYQKSMIDAIALALDIFFDEVLTEDQRSDLMQIARQEAEDAETPHLPPRIIVP